MLVDLFYLVGASLLVAWNRNRIRRREVFALIFFPVPPLLAGLLQTMFFGISVFWLAVSISLLIIYLDLQSTNVHVDHLTGLANRRKIDQFLNHLSTKRRTMQQYGGILIDIDRFKAINDDYGHELGDRVLEGVGKILRRSLGSRDLISRYGGDEFIIILEVRGEEELQAAAKRIQEGVAAFNSHHLYPFELSLSMGYGLWDLSGGVEDLDFLKLLDQRMYQNKQCHLSRG